MLGLLFPLRCVGCGAAAEREPLCSPCRSSLRHAGSVRVPRGVDRAAAGFAHEGAARQVVAAAKYRGRHAAIGWMSEVVAARAGALAAVDVVTWPPTTRARHRARGFDHAEVLARRVAAHLGRPVRPLLRREGTQHQTGAGRAARSQAPRFAVRLPPRAPASVLLVDDVCTTGATASAAARALRAGGVEHVALATFTYRP